MATTILVVEDDSLNRDLVVRCYAKRVTGFSKRATEHKHWSYFVRDALILSLRTI
jgi:hypothetical protein